MDRQDIKLVNCATCKRELLGESMRKYAKSLFHNERVQLPPLVAGRINERPYCRECLNVPKKKGHAAPKDETAPTQDNAIRELEDGR